MKFLIGLFICGFFINFSFCQDCDHFAEISGGQITYDPENEISLPSGARANLKCTVSGFETTAICREGNWHPASLGSCPEPEESKPQNPKRQDLGTNCPALETPANSFLSYSPLNLPPYPSGTMATLNCFLGYSPVGQTAAECEGGQWTQIGTCQTVAVQRCPPLMHVPHGMINYISGGNGPYDYGSIAELTCQFGHSVVGNTRVTCESGGWAPFPGLGQCQEQNVSTTTVVARSRRQLGIGTNSGATCYPLSTFNGHINYIQSNPSVPYSSGTSAMLSCNIGYSASGSSSSFCSNGVWSPSIGSCVSGSLIGVGGLGGLGTTPIGSLGGLGSTTGQCFAIGAFIINGQVTYSSGSSTFGPYPSGTTATVSCNPGYYVSGTTTSTCYNGQWNPMTLGSCTSSGGGTTTFGSGQCFAMPAPIGGNVIYSQSAQGLGTYNQGTTATLTCYSSGVSGASSSSCYNGQWSPALGTCGGFGGNTGSGMTCVAVQTPYNGQVTYSQSSQNFGSYNQGTTATLTCYSGYVSGSSSSVCQNGIWSPSLGTCGGSSTGGGFGSQCYIGVMSFSGGTVQYSNGNTMGPWPSGTSATLNCNGGQPMGQTTAYCQNGAWSPSSFSGCSGGSTIGGIGGTTGAGYCYTTMPTVVGGQIHYSSGSQFGPFPSGTTASLTCTNGQSPQGSTTAFCQNGFWSPSMFNGCGGTTSGSGQCFAMIAPFNGQIRYSSGGTFGPFPSGTTATLVCNSGYGASGSTSATCYNGQFSPSSLGQCVFGASGSTGSTSGFEAESTTEERKSVECDSEVLPLVSNGKLKTTDDPGIVEVVCNTGFASQVSQVTVYCKNGEVRTKESASCVPVSSRSILPKTNSSTCTFPVVHVERGQILYSSGSNYPPFSEGTIATLICELGTQAIGGSTTSTCVQGSWSQEIGTCEVPGRIPGGQCELISRVEGGHIAYSEIFNIHGPFNEGTFATLMCDFGRTLEGQATATCRNSTWSPPVGVCTPLTGQPTAGGGSFAAPTSYPAGIRCPPIKSTSLKSTLEFTQTPLSDGNYPNSTVVRLICLEDGALVTKGVGEAECLNGLWLPRLGECDVVHATNNAEQTKFGGPGICQPLEIVQKGKITYIQSGKRPYQMGTTAILNCDFGYSVSGHAALSCGPKGTWLPASGFGKCVSNADLVH